MRFFSDLNDAAPSEERPIGAPIHDTDNSWGSFPGPTLEDEMEEEFEAERQATIDADVRRAFNAGLAIPDLIVPQQVPDEPVLSTKSWWAEVAMSALPPFNEIVRANRASFVMVPKQLMDELKADLEEMLFARVRRNGDDYNVCRFCQSCSYDGSDIVHGIDRIGNDNCLGIKLKEFFEGQEQGDDH